MKKYDYFIKSFLSALGVLIYVSFVAWLGFNGERIFGHPNTFLMPVFMLLLFVISACITGLLVLGKPVHLYLSGQKREALILLFTTLGGIIFLAFLVALILLVE